MERVIDIVSKLTNGKQIEKLPTKGPIKLKANSKDSDSFLINN
jgi:hypothetical protein